MQFAVTDGLGHGRAVIFSLLRSESVVSYRTALEQFREIMGSVSRLKTFVVDMHYAQMKALVSVFDEKNIMICHFRMLRAIRRKVSLLWQKPSFVDQEHGCQKTCAPNDVHKQSCYVSCTTALTSDNF